MQEEVKHFADLVVQADNIILAKVISRRTENTGIGDSEYSIIFYAIYELMLVNVYKGRFNIGETIDLMQPYQIRHMGMLWEQRGRRQDINTVHLSVGSTYILFLHTSQIDRDILRTGRVFEEPQHVLLSSCFSVFQYASEEEMFVSPTKRFAISEMHLNWIKEMNFGRNN